MISIAAVFKLIQIGLVILMYLAALDATFSGAGYEEAALCWGLAAFASAIVVGES